MKPTIEKLVRHFLGALALHTANPTESNKHSLWAAQEEAFRWYTAKEIMAERRKQEREAIND
jgi:hypothetical protein